MVDEPADQPIEATKKPDVTPATPKPSIKSRLKLFFWKLISLLLLIALIVSVTLWKPWQANIKAGERTVSVNGSATIKSEPDEFVFYPSYSFTNTDKQAALGEISKKSDDIVAKLKTLGVPSSKIKTDSSGYSDLYSASPSGETTYYLSFTVTAANKDLAQKVQDYLITTSPTGSVTPAASFSTNKQKSLESQARDKAEQDARARADQSARNLGFSVNKVKTVEDEGFAGYGGCGPRGLCAAAQSSISDDNTAKLSVQPGENELAYSVRVTYYIK